MTKKLLILVLTFVSVLSFGDTYKHRVLEIPSIVRSSMLQQMQDYLDSHPKEELVHFQFDQKNVLVFVTKEKLKDGD